MNPFTAVIVLLVLFFFVYWLRILPFREKKQKNLNEPPKPHWWPGRFSPEPGVPDDPRAWATVFC